MIKKFVIFYDWSQQLIFDIVSLYNKILQNKQICHKVQSKEMTSMKKIHNY